MTTSSQGHEPARHALRALLLLLTLLALSVSGTAAAATGCGQQLINDWYDGRIDGTYPLHCYDDAIEQLPGDVRVYSSAEDDITRALQARLRGETAPPNSNPPPGEGADDGDGDDDGDGEATPPGGTANGPTDGDAEGIPGGSGENASSVPLPLLLLAGLALLLVAGGAAGYVVRRLQARRITPPAV